MGGLAAQAAPTPPISTAAMAVTYRQVISAAAAAVALLARQAAVTTERPVAWPSEVLAGLPQQAGGLAGTAAPTLTTGQVVMRLAAAGAAAARRPTAETVRTEWCG